MIDLRAIDPYTMYSVTEIHEILKIPKRTIQKYISDKGLKARIITQELHVNGRNLLKWFSHKETPKAEGKEFTPREILDLIELENRLSGCGYNTHRENVSKLINRSLTNLTSNE